MFKLIVVCFFLIPSVWALLVVSSVTPKQVARLDSTEITQRGDSKLLFALISVESGGDDNAVGDLLLSNKAYGCLQIRQPAVDDYNRANNTFHKAEDCRGNRSLSVSICKWYLGHYATSKRLGRTPTDEDRARIWNGGPNGHRKPSTESYWAKVKKALAKQREG